MSLRARYRWLGPAGRVSEARANAVVAAAIPRALDALGWDARPPGALPVTARRVEPAMARGGSLIPAWPRRASDGSVVIEFVGDWGALLAAWRAALGEPADESAELDALVRSGERIWVGIANDVLQLFVPEPPPGTYSLVRHHALMLAAATLWLGPERADRWRRAHERAAVRFLQRLGGRSLWDAIAEAERGLQRLLDDPRARQGASGAIAWLEADSEAASTYQSFLGAASLGLAALLRTVPPADPFGWLRTAVQQEHPRPEFNRAALDQFAASQEAAWR